MNSIGGVSTMVLILVVSFAIDRAVKAVLFLLSFIKPWGRWFPDPLTIEDVHSRATADKKHTFIYYVFAGLLAIGVLIIYGKLSVLGALGLETGLEKDGINPVVDYLVSAVVLISGSDFISKLLQMSGLGGEAQSSSQPVEITGKLILENGNSKKVEKPE